MLPTRWEGAQKSLPRPASDPIARLLSATVLPHAFFIFAQRSEIPSSCTSHRGQVWPCRQPLTCIFPKPSLGSRAWGTNQCGPSTFSMKFPVAVHLPLRLNPVATIGPDSCLPHGHHSNTCSRVEKSCGECEDESEGCDFVGCVMYYQLCHRDL